MIQFTTQPLPGLAPATRTAGFPLGTTSDFALAFAGLAGPPGGVMPDTVGSVAPAAPMTVGDVVLPVDPSPPTATSLPVGKRPAIAVGGTILPDIAAAPAPNGCLVAPALRDLPVMLEIEAKVRTSDDEAPTDDGTELSDGTSREGAVGVPSIDPSIVVIPNVPLANLSTFVSATEESAADNTPRVATTVSSEPMSKPETGVLRKSGSAPTGAAPEPVVATATPVSPATTVDAPVTSVASNTTAKPVSPRTRSRSVPPRAVGDVGMAVQTQPVSTPTKLAATGILSREASYPVAATGALTDRFAAAPVAVTPHAGPLDTASVATGAPAQPTADGVVTSSPVTTAFPQSSAPLDTIASVRLSAAGVVIASPDSVDPAPSPLASYTKAQAASANASTKATDPLPRPMPGVVSPITPLDRTFQTVTHAKAAPQQARPIEQSETLSPISQRLDHAFAPVQSVAAPRRFDTPSIGVTPLAAPASVSPIVAAPEPQTTAVIQTNVAALLAGMPTPEGLAKPLDAPAVTITVAGPPLAPPRLAPAAPQLQPAAQAFAAAMFAASAPVVRESGDDDDVVPLTLATVAPVATPAPAIAVAAPVHGQSPALDLAKQDWMATMIDRIETLRDESGGVRETRMKLLPEALGSVEVSVRRDETGAIQVHIAADTAQARALLSDAAPKLAEMAEQRGVKLGGSSVDAGAGDARREAPAPAPVPVPRRPASARQDTITDTASDTRLA